MRQIGPEYSNSKAKEWVNYTGGVALAALLLPVGVAAGAAACYDNRSLHPLFRQPRRGQGGEVVDVTKFRTIRDNGGAETLFDFGAHDPRASAIGNILRQSTIDELPQLFDVLTGKIALVGERPKTDIARERMEAADPVMFKYYLDATAHVPDGLFGFPQTYGHYVRENTPHTERMRMRYGIIYGETCTLAMDLKCIAETPFELIYSTMQKSYI